MKGEGKEEIGVSSWPKLLNHGQSRDTWKGTEKLQLQIIRSDCHCMCDVFLHYYGLHSDVCVCVEGGTDKGLRGLRHAVTAGMHDSDVLLPSR